AAAYTMEPSALGRAHGIPPTCARHTTAPSRMSAPTTWPATDEPKKAIPSTTTRADSAHEVPMETVHTRSPVTASSPTTEVPRLPATTPPSATAGADATAPPTPTAHTSAPVPMSNA